MNGCFPFMHSCTPHACSAHTEGGITSPRTGVTNGCKWPCRCWDLNSGPTNKGPVLLPAKPSFQPLLKLPEATSHHCNLGICPWPLTVLEYTAATQRVLFHSVLVLCMLHVVILFLNCFFLLSLNDECFCMCI